MKALKNKIDNDGKVAKLAPHSSKWEAQHPLNPKPWSHIQNGQNLCEHPAEYK
jgi:hypothetical protein